MPPSIDALRKDHSITSSAIASGARTRLRCGAILGALGQAGPLSAQHLGRRDQAVYQHDDGAGQDDCAAQSEFDTQRSPFRDQVNKEAA